MKINNYYIPLLVVLILGIISCSDGSTIPDDNFYVPPHLTNATWDQIDNLESEGWSFEQLNGAYEFSI